MARVSEGGEGVDAGGEIGGAVADAEIDVPRDGVAQVHMGDAMAEQVDEADRVAAGSDDVAEVHHDPDLGGESGGQLRGTCGVAAQPVHVQRLGPQGHAERVGRVGCPLQLGGNGIEVLVQ